MEKVIIFGASTMGEIASIYLRKKYNIINFCDNDKNKQGMKLNDITIISPEELEKLGAKVIVASEYESEIFEQLLTMNIDSIEFFRLPFANSSGKGFISCNETVELAKKKGLSMWEFLEKSYGERTDAIINKVIELGCLQKSKRICEIGPGTGRYLKKVIDNMSCDLDEYIIYETAIDWKIYLKNTYPVSVRNTDGYSLKHELDKSVDLIHAHAVFVYLDLVNSFEYFQEMVRICKPGGYIVFDFLPCSFFDVPGVKKWLASEHRFPTVLPESTVENFMKDLGVNLISDFTIEYGPGFSRYHVYRRDI